MHRINCTLFHIILRAPKTEGQKLVTSELRMTWTFLIIAVCYLLFTLPVTIADTIGKKCEWYKERKQKFIVSKL